MTVEQLIQRLSHIGICAKITSGTNDEVFGGRLQENVTDFNLYSDTFLLYKQENEWILSTPGSGQSFITKRYQTLDRAAEQIFELYKGSSDPG